MWALPVSKWELKAKLGLKNAEDMTITCRAKTILLAAFRKTANAWTEEGQEEISDSGAFENQVSCSRSGNAQHFNPSHLTGSHCENPAPLSARADRCWQLFPCHHIVWFICLAKKDPVLFLVTADLGSVHRLGHPMKRSSVIYTDFIHCQIPTLPINVALSRLFSFQKEKSVSAPCHAPRVTCSSLPEQLFHTENDASVNDAHLCCSFITKRLRDILHKCHARYIREGLPIGPFKIKFIQVMFYFVDKQLSRNAIFLCATFDRHF